MEFFHSSSHFAALSDEDFLRRPITFSGAHILYLPDDIHAIDNFAKHHMLAVEMGKRNSGDEELATIGVWTRVLTG